MLMQPKVAAITPETHRDAPIPTKSTPKPDALDLWIDALSVKECLSTPACAADPDGFKRIDSNGEYSYACLQFQAPTFAGYSEQLSLAEGTLRNCADQKRLARAMILDDYSNWQHWWNSVQKLGLPPR